MRNPLTVVAQHWEAIGTAAMELLRARIAEPDSPRVHRLVPVDLIVRASSELPPPAR
jgi:DNA-binding LacI/PurR family transcriptional regulator